MKQFKVTENSKAYWRVTFDNPPLNLLNPETIRELQQLIDRIEAENELRVVVFDSANPEFYFARYDLSRAAETPTNPGPTGYPAWIDFILRIARSSVITIASIRGRTRNWRLPLTCGLPAESGQFSANPRWPGAFFPAAAQTSDCRCSWEGPARLRSLSEVMISMLRPPSAMAGSIGVYRTASLMGSSIT